MVMNARKQAAKCNTGPPIDGGGENRGAAAGVAQDGASGGAKLRLARQKKISPKCIFHLHAVTSLVSCTCELALPQRRERVSFRRTRVKIEFYIASRPATFPCNPNSEKKSHQAYALAACGCHLLHGVRGHLWHGRDHSRRGLRPRDFNFVVPASAVVPADSVHDRRTFERTAARGRLLRVGAPRLGELLGLSGSVALTGREYL